MLRELTARLGILLIFDEVVSFRVAFGGAQQHFGVLPDLTCLGKAIGVGFPLGAFGGRADVMAAFDPTAPGGPRIPHPGSLNANPVSLVAGSVTLDLLTPEAIARLDRLGHTARARIRTTLAGDSVPARVTGLGSLFGIHLTDRGLLQRLHLGLFTEGVLLDPRGVGCLSTAVTDGDLDVLAAALERVTGRWTATGPRPYSATRVK
jgi:glutamate-1-semialdehyde 2,1-aminomutase